MTSFQVPLAMALAMALAVASSVHGDYSANLSPYYAYTPAFTGTVPAFAVLKLLRRYHEGRPHLSVQRHSPSRAHGTPESVMLPKKCGVIPAGVIPAGVTTYGSDLSAWLTLQYLDFFRN